MYLVKFETSTQITEDHFVSYFEEKLFFGTATINEIKSWVQSKIRTQRDNPEWKLPEVILSQPE